MQSNSDGLTHAERAAQACSAPDSAGSAVSVHAGDSDAPKSRTVIVSKEQVQDIFLLTCSFDGKMRGEFEASAWLRLLGGKTMEDVTAAVYEHFRHSRWSIAPADILDILSDWGE